MNTAWKNLLISPKTSILQTIEAIDNGAIGAVVVVDENRQLLGMVTDGDIRRGTLKRIPLHEPVYKVMNPKPKTGNLNDSKLALLNILQRLHLQQIPIVDEIGQVMGVETVKTLSTSHQIENWVVIMAGGLGMRLRPLTEHCPKPLLRVGQKPVLELILERFIEQGFGKFYLALNYYGEMIRGYFGDGSRFGITIQYLEESQPLGTAGALSLLPNPPDKPFIVMNGDIITRVNFQNLLQFHEEQQASVSICVREHHYTVPYGVAEIHDDHITGLVEKPEQQYLVNAGIYVLSPAILKNVAHNTRLDMPDLLNQSIQKGHQTAAFPIREYWIDIGRREDLERAHLDQQAYVSSH